MDAMSVDIAAPLSGTPLAQQPAEACLFVLAGGGGQVCVCVCVFVCSYTYIKIDRYKIGGDT